MSSRTTRGYWKLGAIGCRGASWSEELDDKELHGAREDRSQDFPIFWTTSSHRLLVPLHSSATTECGMLVSKDYVRVVVPQTNNAPYSSAYLSCAVRSRIGISTRSLLSKRILSVQ